MACWGSAAEEVIDPLDDHQMVFARNRWNQRLDLVNSSKFIVASVNQQLGFCALVQKREIGAIDGYAQPDEMGDSRMLAAHAQPYPSSKTETREQ